MTRYFFDSRCPRTNVHDDEGIAFDRPAEAVAMAKRALGEMCRQGAEREDEGLFTVTVRDDQGHVAFKASMCLDTTRVMGNLATSVG